ncbi:MAG: glucose dehydrogenase [Saprospirales bacterium TMED214]|nr:MAG: glucose dehydrogenase [Saprospirales bacterium TMED214]
MSWNAKESVAVVTGASSGIGKCLTQRLADHGCHVIAVARRADRIHKWQRSASAHEFGGVTPVVGDITDAEVRSTIRSTIETEHAGKLDLLVNNAGIGGIGRFAEATPDRLRQIMEVNFFAPVELTRLLLPSLQRGSASVICNISSVLGHCAVPDKSEYCASKFAMHGWSDSLRAELAADGIQVTLVSPSTTKSEFFDSLIETSPNQQSRSLGHWTPQKVANKAFNAICKRRREVILSLGGKALVYFDRLAPALMDKILAQRPAKPTDLTKTGDR